MEVKSIIGDPKKKQSDRQMGRKRIEHGTRKGGGWGARFRPNLGRVGWRETGRQSIKPEAGATPGRSGGKL